MTGVRESQISGVLCFWVDMGRPLSSAHLIFRHGLADEPLPESGWLHLLEHLALLDRETLSRPISGSVSSLLTRFEAYGAPDDVVERLSALCVWLGDPDFRLLARERGVLQARAQLRIDPLVRTLPWRYGAAGPGVAGYLEVGSVRASPELLAARARRVFNRSNAVLVLDGEPPASLRLPLPQGEYHAPSVAQPVARRLPATYLDDSGLALSGVVPRGPDADFLPGLLGRAVHDGLRTRTGGVYAPWSSHAAVDDQHIVVAAGSDVIPEVLPAIAEAGLDISRRLAEDGVPRAWLTEAVEARIVSLQRTEAAFEVALGSAYAVLSDRVPQSQEELLDETRSTDPDRIDAVARAFHDSLLLGVPHRARRPAGAPLVSVTEVEPAGVVPRHRHVDWPADLTTFATDSQTIEKVRGETAQRIRVSEVAAVFAWRDGTRQVIGRDGSVLEMEARQWQRGAALTAALDEAVPADLLVPMSDREVAFQPMGLAERAAVAFARSANTVPGLSVLLALTLVLAVLSLLGGRLALGVVLLLLALTLAAQLWQVGGGHRTGLWPPRRPHTAPSHAP